MMRFEQDPAGPFNFESLSTIAIPFSDWAFHPVALLVSFSWVLALAWAITQNGLARLDVENRQAHLSSRTKALWVTALLLLVPALLLAVTQLTGNGKYQLPVGPWSYITQPTIEYVDYAAEFVPWADERYGVELTAEQAEQLREKKSSGRYSYHDYTHIVAVGDQKLYATFSPSGAQLLFDAATDKELPVLTH